MTPAIVPSGRRQLRRGDASWPWQRDEAPRRPCYDPIVDLVLPLTRFPMPEGDPMEWMTREAETNAARVQGLPWTVIAGTGRERLAVSRPDLAPEECALASTALLERDDIQWVFPCGEAVLVSGLGVLRHVFVLRSFPGGRWESAVRPFVAADELVWLGEWARYDGEEPGHELLHPLFPKPRDARIRFLRDSDETIEPAAVQEVPEGATEHDIARMAGHLMESFFVSHGFVPPSTVRLAEGRLEVRLLPRSSDEHAAGDLAIRLAQEPETQAVGVFSRARDSAVQPPAEQVRLELEFREGGTFIWRRRFRIVGENRARWLDAAGDVLEAPKERGRHWLL